MSKIGFAFEMHMAPTTLPSGVCHSNYSVKAGFTTGSEHLIL
jgi:hypothetical protein